MPSTYTLNNGIELIGTGEQSGTWGDTTNTNFELLDTSLDGQVSVTLSATGSGGSPNTLPISDGSSSNGRNRLVIFGDSADIGGTVYVQLTPNDAEKIIYVRNNLSGSRSILLFQGTYNASNDYEVPAGTTAVVFFNGAGTGAVAANVFNNAHFDALNIVGAAAVGTTLTVGTSLNISSSTTVDGVLDEDNMASNSATKLSTQQSIKAYVDSQVGTVDTLAEILANGNTTGGTDLSVSTGDDIRFADSSKIIMGASNDLQIYHDATAGASKIYDAGAGNLELISNGSGVTFRNPSDEETFSVLNAGATTLYHNRNSKLATTSTGIDVTGNITNASGDLTIDVAGDIILDADGQQIIFADGGTQFGQISTNSTPADMAIKSLISDGDIIFQGIDGGASITALTLDMSEAGNASFNANVTVGANFDVSSGTIKLDGNFPTGSGNVALGNGTFENITSGDFNVALGNSVLNDLTSGNSNIGIGQATLDATTTGGFNNAMGSNSLGANTTGSNNTALGHSALESNTTASSNVAVGYSAMLSNTTAVEGTAVGVQALYSNTTGVTNTAVGRRALYSNTTGLQNVGLGARALYTNTGGDRNIAVGMDALYSNTTADGNIAVGHEAAYSNTTGSNNVALGRAAFFSNTTGTYNTALGKQSLRSNTTANSNVAVGYQSLYANTTGALNSVLGTNALDANTTGANNVAIGFEALTANTTASNNTAVGKQAMLNNTTGIHHTAVGQLALSQNTTGTYNTALGSFALQNTTTGYRNVGLGYGALRQNTVGFYNIGIGFGAGGLTTTGDNNTTVGSNAFASNTTGGSNVAIGTDALENSTTANNNVAVGYQASYSTTTGGRNVTMGKQALYYNTTGSNNTASGHLAMHLNTTGSANAALGVNALYNNTTASSNTSMGYYTLYSNTTGAQNVGVGRQALYFNTTASDNIAFGFKSLYTTTTGSGKNIGLGTDSGGGVTTGNNNVFIGYKAGNYTTITTTGSSNVLVGNFLRSSSAGGSSGDFSMGLGYDLTCAGGYTTLGKSGSDIRAQHGVATWSTVSDERYKKEIVDSTAGLSFINDLTPRTFKYKNLGELPDTFESYKEGSTDVFKNSYTNHGFIAQEVKTAIDAHPEIKDGFTLWDDREDGSQEVAEAALIPVLVKALQELSAKNDALEARIATLEG